VRPQSARFIEAGSRAVVGGGDGFGGDVLHGYLLPLGDPARRWATFHAHDAATSPMTISLLPSIARALLAVR
jgi:hypothetical protein